MKDLYESEQRKIPESARRKDLAHIDAFYMVLNGDSPEKARLHFRSGGSRSPRVWVIDYTCQSYEHSPHYIQ